MGRNYRNIVAWQRGHELTLKVYRITKSFSSDERYGLTSQLRRAAYSVPANIAEGSGRATNRDYLRFLHTALGSLNEVDYFIFLAHELGMLSAECNEELKRNIVGAFSALNGLVKAVKKEVDLD